MNRSHPARPGASIETLAFEEGELDQSIATRFERVVARYPDHVAVETETTRWTYAELNRRANAVARVLLDQADGAPEPVAVLMRHDAPLMAALLGALKAGKFFSVLDPDYPLPYSRALLDDLGARWLVTDGDNATLARDVAPAGCQMVVFETLSAEGVDADLKLDIPAATPAAVLYTSGSTGRPKGVVRPQQLLLYRAWLDQKDLGTAPGDRVAALGSPVFAGPLSDVMTSLLTGATLLPFAARYHSADALGAWIARAGLTVLRPPLGLLRQLLAALDPDQVFPALRRVELGGDVVYRQDVTRFLKHVGPACQFIHRYATSETGVVARMVIDPAADLTSEIIPVGYPTQGREILILDEAHRPVVPGAVGEIVVRGRILALGYWRQPDLDNARFAVDPADPALSLYFTGDLGRLDPAGRLVFVGREDTQVKIRGYRVELTVIESALLDLPGVGQATVVAQPGPVGTVGEKRLVAYVTLKNKRQAVSELRAALARTLPAHMLPAVFVTLDSLPLTPNGKVNRRALPEPDPTRPALATAHVAPRTPTEARLAAIWRAVLGVEGIGVHDSFMDLGGDSLLAAQVASRIGREFQTRIPAPELFRATSIAQLAARLDAERPDGLPTLIEAIEALSDEEAERLLLEEEHEHVG